MGITINGSSAAGNIDLGTNGTITDLAVGGVPDNTIDNGAMADDAIGVAELSATGTASSSTYLRGDNSWATVSTDPTTTSGTNNFTVADGNLVIGTAGHGIDFSADANNAGKDNELLDDYEEGYFTFTMDSENGDAWTSRAGYTKMRYVKIGNQVTFSGKYETNSTGGSPSGRLQITNLPFASIAATSDASNTRAFHGYVKGMSSDNNMIMHLWWMGANSTTLLLHSFSNDNNGDMQSFAVDQLATSTVWEGDVTGTYFTS